jgi:hypothetical protein
MKFEGDIPAFEAACLKEVRESLESCDRAEYECSPFRKLIALELEGTYPDTAVVLTYRYKAKYKPTAEDLRAIWHIWADPGEYSVFKPYPHSSDEMWSEAGERRRSFG